MQFGPWTAKARKEALRKAALAQMESLRNEKQKQMESLRKEASVESRRAPRSEDSLDEQDADPLHSAHDFVCRSGEKKGHALTTPLPDHLSYCGEKLTRHQNQKRQRSVGLFLSIVGK